MKKICLTVLFFIIINVTAVYAAYEPYTPPAICFDIEESAVRVEYPNGAGNENVFCNGRLCVQLDEGARLLGAELADRGGSYSVKLGGKSSTFYISDKSNRPTVFMYGGKAYISLYELVTPFGFTLTADLTGNAVRIITAECGVENISRSVSAAGKAYIRLEDIMADGLKPDGSGKYSTQMLEKLKYTAEYLYLRGQEYYVGWIPVYADPADNYWNDVSKGGSLYNAYFLYVMDYMADHGGHIGLHGYTHQYGNAESAVGFEWGEDTPFSPNEQQRRMRAATECADKLGYKVEFFEFPHYGATDEQLLMAEYYFDMICQFYPSDKLTNYLTCTDRSGKNVIYLPTPADYVHFRRDYAIFDKLDACFANGYTVSLFYHPVLDEPTMEIVEKDGKHIWSYGDEATLPSLVDYVTARGYAFGTVF